MQLVCTEEITLKILIKELLLKKWSYLKVDIIWEDANFDYKEKGLFGYYSSTYHKKRYDSGVLSIYSDDITITIIQGQLGIT